MTMSDIGLFVQTACIWEVTARKLGNVNRLTDFADVHYVDFLLSAAAIAPVLASANQQKVGLTILEAVRATQRVTRTNTNLGVILLLAPLAAVPAGEDLRLGVSRVLHQLDVEDARLAYEAIRLARPGGLGRVDDQDVATAPSVDLRSAMALAADRDSIARQYANDFKEVFEWGLPILNQGLKSGSLETAVIGCHLSWMAAYPDSLIARKVGLEEAESVQERAVRIIQVGWPRGAESKRRFAELDAWLREDGHQRNPGTSADLTAACLFAALRAGTISLPLSIPWSAEPCQS